MLQNRATLDRIEENFDAPSYIYLVRHPRPVIESMVRMNISGSWPDVSTAEKDWRERNENALHHLETIPSHRKRRIRFEDLVRDPETTLSSLCDLLKIPFASGMENPYASGRLLEGIGCPNLPKRARVDPSLAEAWRERELDFDLDDETLALAAILGYGEACASGKQG